MKWPLGWSRVVTWLSGVIITSYGFQSLGGRISTPASFCIVAVVTVGTAWLFRGSSAEQTRWRAVVVAAALVGFALVVHALLPGVAVERTVLLSDVTVSSAGKNLLVGGVVERVGEQKPVTITISSPSVSTVLVVPPSKRRFSALLRVNLADPCSTFVTVAGPNDEVLSPLRCRQ